MYGMCLKWFQEKRTRQNGNGFNFAEAALFGKKMVFLCFRVFGKLCTHVFACYKVLRLFEMKPRLAFIRWMSCIDFCKFLAFEEKLEVTMPKPVQTCLPAPPSWYKLPDICGYNLQQKIRSMAKDLQSSTKHT